MTTSSVGNRGRANEDGKQTGLDEMNFNPVKCMMIIIMLGWTEKKRLQPSAPFFMTTRRLPSFSANNL